MNGVGVIFFKQDPISVSLTCEKIAPTAFIATPLSESFYVLKPDVTTLTTSFAAHFSIGVPVTKISKQLRIGVLQRSYLSLLFFYSFR